MSENPQGEGINIKKYYNMCIVKLKSYVFEKITVTARGPGACGLRPINNKIVTYHLNGFAKRAMILKYIRGREGRGLDGGAR